MHGYELIQAMKVATGGSLSFGEGCIYPILHRLEAEHVLRSQRVTVEGRERLVYTVTAKGRRRLSQSASTWQQISQAVTRALQGTNDVHTEMA
jgi:PadR family transcriptional regulator PadR